MSNNERKVNGKLLLEHALNIFGRPEKSYSYNKDQYDKIWKFVSNNTKKISKGLCKMIKDKFELKHEIESERTEETWNEFQETFLEDNL